MKIHGLAAPAILVAMLAAGCSAENAALPLRELTSPAASGSSLPNLITTVGGRTFLNWVEPADDGGHALRFSTLGQTGWSAARTVAQGNNWFVNWADFPSMTVLNDGTLAAHWLRKSGADTYAYDIELAFSNDDGNSWQEPVVPHSDATQTEHGFVSLSPWRANRLLAVWLDGRRLEAATETHDAHGHGGEAMALRYGILTSAGVVEEQGELDARTCDCCQTAATALADEVLIAWRDRSDTEIRDISLQRFSDAGWEQSYSLHDDHWKIEACPVNGPALDSAGNNVAVAWFTGAGNVPRVYVRLSRDGGRQFGPVIGIDAGRPLGRVDVEVMPDGSALVLWMEHAGGGAEIRLRRVGADGSAGRPWIVAGASAERASGFPRMTLTPEFLVLAWTDIDATGGDSVRTALVPAAQLQAGR